MVRAIVTGPAGNFGKSLKIWYYLVLDLGIVELVVVCGVGNGTTIACGPLKVKTGGWY